MSRLSLILCSFLAAPITLCGGAIRAEVKQTSPDASILPRDRQTDIATHKGASVHSSTAPGVKPETLAPEDAPRSSQDHGDIDDEHLKAQLLKQIGDDLESLDSDFAIDELNWLARYALEIERPDIFRTVMVSHVDNHWEGLSDARTALNMIAWLPDTADNLMPRIIAARLAISENELPDLEAQRLWRDLRARVERVGDPVLLEALASAMIRSGSADLLIDTVNRFHTTDRKRIETLIHLMETEGPNMPSEISDMIYKALVDLGGVGAGGERSAPGIARALWSVGRTKEALLILTLEPDPLIRLRTRFELLAKTAPEQGVDLEEIDSTGLAARPPTDAPSPK